MEVPIEEQTSLSDMKVDGVCLGEEAYRVLGRGVQRDVGGCFNWKHCATLSWWLILLRFGQLFRPRFRLPYWSAVYFYRSSLVYQRKDMDFKKCRQIEFTFCIFFKLVTMYRTVFL